MIEKDQHIASCNKNPLGSLSQWKLIWLNFKRHRLAYGSMFFLMVLYTLALFCEFFAPYQANWKNVEYAYCPPQPLRFSIEKGLYVYNMEKNIDPVTFRKNYVEDKSDVVPVRLFVKGQPYKLFGVIPWNRHFIGIDLERYHKGTAIDDEEIGCFYLLGSDKYGRDVLTRILYGARISLSIGMVAIIATMLLGITIGGISGYVGGNVDIVIQRVVEIINTLPRLPMWLALGAAMPPEWSPIETYFAITIVLSLLGWGGLARGVRGKILSLREEDYAIAAKLLGASDRRILFRHLVPGFTSHIIVSLTMRVPVMILGETSLSFLGLGLRPPVVSWGVMLQDCMNMQVVANYPWILLPLVFLIIMVLGFNFLGDGLRDAADPYSAR